MYKSLRVSEEVADLIPVDVRESLEKGMKSELDDLEYRSTRYCNMYLDVIRAIDRHADLEREAYRHIISKLLEKQKLEPRTIPSPLEKKIVPEPVVKKLGQGRRKFPDHLFKSSLT